MKGLFAAVPTPADSDGRLDLATFDRIVDLASSAGVDGICIGGATGEFPHFEVAERLALLRHAAASVPQGCALLVGIGAPSPRRAIELGRAARDAGSRALLLPMPMFFRYAQDDLQTFASHVSRTIAFPCLLYDLPDFTNGLEPETVLTLLKDEEFIAGIKDSSGREERLAAFARAPQRERKTLLVGDDRLLAKGLKVGWDGGISGVAGFCPELLVALYRSVVTGDPAEATRLQALLDELITHLAAFPTPWGIRLGLAARGLDTGPLPLPLAGRRLEQARQFTAWFPAWLARHVPARR